MKKFPIFQIVVMVVCIIGVVFAMLIFTGKIPIGQNKEQSVIGSVTIWGTLPYDAFYATLDPISKKYKGLSITYVEKDAKTFQSEFVEALASGQGPDLITLSPGDVIQNKNKLLVVPFTSLPETTFRSTFVDQSELFLTDQGILALPFVIDPLIMYYNRDLLTSSFIVAPPKTWDEVIALNKSITQQDEAGRLSVQTVALGTFANILHAKDLISLFIFQLGNKMVDFDDNTKKYVSVFADTPSGQGSPTATAISLYTSFANVSNSDRYSWNPNLPMDRDQFIAGNLALYFGYSSEIASIRQKNPNLNFDVALMPQQSKTSVKMTYGTMYGLAVVKSSQNTSAAVITAQEVVSQVSTGLYLAQDPMFVPARKDMLLTVGDDARKDLFYKSAIISRGWIDPDPAQTTALFKKYIDQINAGLASPDSILGPGNSLLGSILQKLQPSPMVQ